MPNFNSVHKAVLDDLLLGHPLLRSGKMFGFPLWYDCLAYGLLAGE